MLGQLLNLSPRRLLTLALILGGGLLAALLILLWQLGVFDSPPPPAALQSAVESLSEDDQQQQTASQQESEQPQQQSSLVQDEPQQQTAEQSAAADPGASQPQQDQQAQPDAESAESEQATVDQYQDQYQDDYGDDVQQDAEQQQAQQAQQAQQVQQAQPQQEQQESSAQPSSLADLAGSWTISERGESFVGYRIGEELANIGTTTAVGRTGEIEATLEFDGAAITSVVITADLRSLRSDESFRDSALRTRGIETDTYPFATFTLTEPIAIDAVPVAGQTLSVTVAGTLELHGVTNAVAVDLQGQYVDGLVVVAGSTEIALADYDIEKPTGFRVLSIEDIGIMEFELVFERVE